LFAFGAGFLCEKRFDVVDLGLADVAEQNVAYFRYSVVGDQLGDSLVIRK